MPKRNQELARAMGKRMTERRKELGLTQENVADIAGIAHQQYNKAENGRVCLGSESLLRVSTALQISADFLLTGKSGPDRYQDTVAILNKLTERQLKIANQVLECVVRLGDEK